MFFLDMDTFLAKVGNDLLPLKLNRVILLLRDIRNPDISSSPDDLLSH